MIGKEKITMGDITISIQWHSIPQIDLFISRLVHPFPRLRQFPAVIISLLVHLHEIEVLLSMVYDIMSAPIYAFKVANTIRSFPFISWTISTFAFGNVFSKSVATSFPCPAPISNPIRAFGLIT